MNLKKIVCTVAVMGMALTSAMPVFAADVSQDTTTTFSYTKKNDPTYTVTIPSSLTITEEGSELKIEASDVNNLDGKKVSVTIAGTDKFRNQMLVSAKVSSSAKYNSQIKYTFTDAEGNVIETTGSADEVVGKELASFTEDGNVSYTVKPYAAHITKAEPDLEYTGTMTFGISLVEAE
jgi:hypothetical protein